MTTSSSSEALTSTISTDAITSFCNASILPQPLGQIVAVYPLPLTFVQPAPPVTPRRPEASVMFPLFRKNVRAAARPDEDVEATLCVKVYFAGRLFILCGLCRRPLTAFV